MPDQEQILRDAYSYFANWSANRQQFEALLDSDVQWIETDPGLTAKTYQGRADVMAHVDDIQRKVTSANLVSVSSKPQGWQTKDNMQVSTDAVHCCITDVSFTDNNLISQVNHFKGHAQNIGRRCS
jgi:hypothetical protein